MNRISPDKILNSFFALVIFCSSFAFLTVDVKAVDVKADNASVEGARAVLIRLAGLSKKQALRTEPAQKLLTGEMLSLDMPSFGKLTDAPDKVLLPAKNRAVGRFQLFGENNQVADVYFYLQYDKGWKVSAVRLLALTGIIEQVYLGLKAKPNLTAEEKEFYENYKLTLSPDKELKTWFLQNRNLLNKLCAQFPNKSGGKEVYISRDDKKFPHAADLLRKLNLSSADMDSTGNIEIVIGGITDNTVGFIYSPSKKPPQMNPSLYIWVEEVAANWYLFRTT